MTEVNNPAVDFTVEDLDGMSVTLSSHKGKVVFLNFWATWCPPCRAEMPSLEKLYNNMKGRNFVMLLISTGEKNQTVKNFIDKNKYSFPVFLDSDNRVSNQYGVAGIPTTMLINKEGVIVLRETGSRDWSTPDIVSLIERLLK